MIYDLIIIGAGPAGLTAALYAARYNLNILLIGQEIGGYLPKIPNIENYPGFSKISGIELTRRMTEQIQNYGVKIIEQEIIDIKKDGNFTIYGDKNKYESKTIIIAIGTQRRRLGLPEEKDFLGKGLSYCVTCDAPFFKEKTVAVIGGSDSAAMAALFLSEYAKKIYIIYRRDKLRAEPIKVEQIKKNKKIEIIYNTEVKKINGQKFVESIILNNKKQIRVDGVFVEIGLISAKDLSEKLKIKLDKQNNIITNEIMETNIDGVFAAGDITNRKLKQIVTSAAQGAIAANSAFYYIKNRK